MQSRNVIHFLFSRAEKLQSCLGSFCVAVNSWIIYEKTNSAVEKILIDTLSQTAVEQTVGLKNNSFSLLAVGTRESYVSCQFVSFSKRNILDIILNWV